MKDKEERLFRNEKDFESLRLKYNFLEKEYLQMKGRARERSAGRTYDLPSTKGNRNFQEKLRYM